MFELMALLAVVVPIVTIAVAIMVSIPAPFAIAVTVSGSVVFLLANLSFPVAIVFTLANLSLSLIAPGVIAVNAAVFSLPITLKESFSVVTRCNPAGSDVGRPTPVAFMPLVMVSDRVPVTLDPEELGPGARRPEVNHARCRWGTNSDSDGHLCECRHGKEESSSKQTCSQETLSLSGIHGFRMPPWLAK
jgi:hypothetical protein